MLDLLNLKPEAFGLDISDLSLKIAKLKKKGKFFTLSSFGEAKIKPGIIQKGEIKDEKALSEIIKEAINKVGGEKIKTKYVISSLPEEKAFLQVIALPILSREDLKSAVTYEAENYIPLPLEEVYLDFQVVPPVDHLKHLEVLIAALPRKTIDPYINCLKEAGLKPLALEIESLSVARALIKKEIFPSSVLLIDLGATRTGFVIFSGSSVRFTSSILVSSNDFTEIIAKTLKTDIATAEKLKIKYGLTARIKAEKETKKEPEKEKVSEALIPPLTDLIQQIKRYIDYYQTHTLTEHLPPNGKSIEKVLLCGGGANLKGLPELLSQELKISVEIGNPWINILAESQKESAQLSFSNSLAYATALGLALRAAKQQC